MPRALIGRRQGRLVDVARGVELHDCIVQAGLELNVAVPMSGHVSHPPRVVVQAEAEPMVLRRVEPIHAPDDKPVLLT